MMRCSCHKLSVDEKYSGLKKEMDMRPKSIARFWVHVSLFALVALLYTGHSVNAENGAHLIAMTIPASACEPSNDEGDAPVKLARGSWVFADGATGMATLFCPLPLSGWGIEVDSLDGYVYLYAGGEVSMTSYRVYYRDNDGLGLINTIRTRLAYRNQHTRHFVGDWWDSSNHPEMNNTWQVVNLGHTLHPNRLYMFYVQIERQSLDFNPAFSGIDFPPPEPAG
jgi:hypothetical protein